MEESLRERGRSSATPASSGYDEEPVRVPVFGVGGAGCHALEAVHHRKVPGIVTVAIDTDWRLLYSVESDGRIPAEVAAAPGIGAGGYPEYGKKAVEASAAEIGRICSGSMIVFVLAGLGGGTGTGGAPVVARIAREAGALVVALVSFPFDVERARHPKAREGLKELLSHADSVILFDSNRLLSYLPCLPLGQAFRTLDAIAAESVLAIADVFNAQPMDMCERGVDLMMVFRRMIGGGGFGLVLAGESLSENKAESVVHECLSHPLADMDFRRASVSIVRILGGPEMTLNDVLEIAGSLTYDLDPHADVIWGCRTNEKMRGFARVFAIMFGIPESGIGKPFLD